jgi:hypothetical protein
MIFFDVELFGQIEETSGQRGVSSAFSPKSPEKISHFDDNKLAKPALGFSQTSDMVVSKAERILRHVKFASQSDSKGENFPTAESDTENPSRRG